MSDVFRCRKPRRVLVLFVVLPEIFESFFFSCAEDQCRATGVNCEVGTYSFDVFIAGHVAGKQNSAIDPYYACIQAINLKTVNSKYNLTQALATSKFIWV